MRTTSLLLFLVVSCAGTLTVSDELRYGADDLRSAAQLVMHDEPHLATDLIQVATAADEAAALLEGGGEFSSLEGLIATIDALLAREGLDPKVGAALVILQSRLRRLAPPGA